MFLGDQLLGKVSADAAARNAKPHLASAAQHNAGNYPKGHAKVGGLDVSIENPVGSVRSGVGADGKPWMVVIKDHYGYVRRTTGRDGEHVDVFVVPGTPENWNGSVYIIDQKDTETGGFDEHKIVLGAETEIQARRVYRRNYNGPATDRMMGLYAITLEQFKQWLEDGDTTLPFGLHVSAAQVRKGGPGSGPQEGHAFRGNQWTGGQGGDVPSIGALSSPGYIKQVEEAVEKEAQKQGYFGKVTVTDEDKKFSINGQTHNYAGSCNIYSEDKEIKVYTQGISGKDVIPYVLSHEIGHAKFQTAYEREGEVRKEVRENMKAGKDSWMAKEDGVSTYSRMHWEAFQAGKQSLFLAVHETFAELHSQETLGGSDYIKNKVSEKWQSVYAAMKKEYAEETKPKEKKPKVYEFKSKLSSEEERRQKRLEYRRNRLKNMSPEKREARRQRRAELRANRKAKT